MYFFGVCCLHETIMAQCSIVSLRITVVFNGSTCISAYPCMPCTEWLTCTRSLYGFCWLVVPMFSCTMPSLTRISGLSPPIFAEIARGKTGFRV